MNPSATSGDAAFPPRPKYEPLPRRGLLAAAGFDLKIARRAAPETLLDRPPLLAGLTRLAVGTDSFLAGPALGAPMAVMALEELIRRGAEEVIFLGLAGGLMDKSEPAPLWSIGDLCLPEAGLSTEGTSAHYPAPLRPEAGLCARIKQAQNGELKGGPIWSTDAVYRETAELAAAQWAQGARAVDMECTALWAAAAFRGLKLAALLVISDLLLLSHDRGLEHQVGYHQASFKQGLSRAAETAWRALTL